MSFTQTQVRKLRSRLKPQHIRTREAEGITLSYLEGWHVLAEANRIFGFDGWDRETVSSECVWTKQVNGRYCAAYVARIRIRVRAGEAVIVREGSGAGESNAATPGQAHEFASKAAETDATKRALMTFGNAFGLSLYAGTPEPKHKAIGSPRGALVPEASEVPVPRTEAPGIEAEAPADAVEAPVSTDPEPPGALAPSLTTILPVTLPGPDWPQITPLDEAERLNRERTARIDKSALTLSEPRRERNPAIWPSSPRGHAWFAAKTGPMPIT